MRSYMESYSDKEHEAYWGDEVEMNLDDCFDEDWQPGDDD